MVREDSIMPGVRLLAAISAGGVLETVTLYRSGARTVAGLYAAASVLSGFSEAYCGVAIAQAIH